MLQKVNNRVLYFDNAKFILIYLVVFGHIISPYSGDDHFLNTLYKTIYTFHMPAFILISGYFAKGFRKKGYIKKLAIKLLIPYFIFQTLFTLFFYMQGESTSFSLFEPQWTLWFLISLFSWHILLFGFTKIKFPFLVSIATGVLVGTVPFIGTDFSLSRTFVFFPFFMLGFLLQKKHFDRLVNVKYKIFGSITLLLLFLSYYFFFYDISKRWLFASYSYTDIVAVEEIGILVRFILYVVMFLAVFSFLAFIPQRNYFFTKLGSRTLYVYLLHGIVIRTIEITPFHDYLAEISWYPIFIIEGIILALLLASKPTMKYTRILVEPIKTK